MERLIHTLLLLAFCGLALAACTLEDPSPAPTSTPRPEPTATRVRAPLGLECNDQQFKEAVMELSEREKDSERGMYISEMYDGAQEIERNIEVLRCEGEADTNWGRDWHIVYWVELDKDKDGFFGFRFVQPALQPTKPPWFIEPHVYPTVTRPPTPVPTNTSLPTPVIQPDHVMTIATHYYGAATPSVEERIFLSDVVVVARLVSDTNGVLTFRAIEYLKGRGPSEFTIPSSTGRNTKWDNRDAVLFLTTSPDTDATGQGNTARGAGDDANTSPTFQFTDTARPPVYPGEHDPRNYQGNLPEGDTVDSQNPVWLPSESGGVSGGASGAESPPSDSGTFLVSDGSETITLSELKSKIAWIHGGAGIDGYDECIHAALRHERDVRDREAYSGRPYLDLPDETTNISSSDPTGTVIVDQGGMNSGIADVYDTFWIQGPDKDLFNGYIDDDDERPGNGFGYKVVTKRPLPAGTYKFQWILQFQHEVPCNYVPSWHDKYLPTNIVVSTAPAGTIYEGFFDLLVGAAGVPLPSEFTAGGTSTAVQWLEWRNGAVTLLLFPYANLAGHTLDFIALDGTVALSLDANLATADSTAGTLTWAVANQPWQEDDQLMLRIRKGIPAPTTTPEP